MVSDGINNIRSRDSLRRKFLTESNCKSRNRLHARGRGGGSSETFECGILLETYPLHTFGQCNFDQVSEKLRYSLRSSSGIRRRDGGNGKEAEDQPAETCGGEHSASLTEIGQKTESVTRSKWKLSLVLKFGNYAAHFP